MCCLLFLLSSKPLGSRFHLKFFPFTWSIAYFSVMLFHLWFYLLICCLRFCPVPLVSVLHFWVVYFLLFIRAFRLYRKALWFVVFSVVMVLVDMTVRISVVSCSVSCINCFQFFIITGCILNCVSEFLNFSTLFYFVLDFCVSLCNRSVKEILDYGRSWVL